jgi:hypothetical protein
LDEVLALVKTFLQVLLHVTSVVLDEFFSFVQAFFEVFLLFIKILVLLVIGGFSNNGILDHATKVSDFVNNSMCHLGQEASLLLFLLDATFFAFFLFVSF